MNIGELVGELTIEQKDIINGQLYAPDSYFYPIQDINNIWIISTQEINDCISEEYMLVKKLLLIPFSPRPSPPPF